MKIYLGADHAGFELKEKLAYLLKELGHEVEDKGPAEYDPNDDYPDYIAPVARAVSDDPSARGIVLGGSGQGEAMVANRFNGVRASVWYGGGTEVLKVSREHNDANMLAIGTRFAGEEETLHAVKIWLETPFSGEERHRRRIAKIDQNA